MLSLLACGVVAACSSAPTGPASEDVWVEPRVVALSSGETVQIRARANGKIPQVSWASQDPSVAVVSDEGLVRAIAPGTVRIEATFNRPGQGNGLTKKQATVRVQDSGTFSEKAFPEAEGWGATALSQCDRSRVQLLRVSSLGDAGPGTLREVLGKVDSSVLTVVRFDVSGYIDLNDKIDIRQGCLYLAGQTAPGGGVTIRATDKKALYLKGHTRDVVIRYLRFRNGTERPGVNTGSQGLIIGAGVNVVVDHLSFSWTNDELMSIYRYPEKLGWGDVKFITVQNTLLAEPLASSPACFSTKGKTDLEEDSNGIPQWYEVENISFHRNAALHCNNRAPKIASRDAAITNSVIYNWGIGAVHAAGRKPYVDVIGNYFKRGPMTRGSNERFGREYSHAFRNNRPGGGSSGGEPDAYVLIGSEHLTWDGRQGPTVYLSGNIGPNNPSGSLDNWVMTSKYKNDGDEYPESVYGDVQYAESGLMPSVVDGVPMRRHTRLSGGAFPVALTNAQTAWQELIVDGDVGANRRLDCRGDWVESRDGVDQRLLREAREGTGVSQPPQSELEVGGFPDLVKGDVCVDSDRDGMPDDFEERWGLSTADPSDAEIDSDGDGYLNLEEYLNGTRPR